MGLFALVSLAVLVYASVSLAFSVTVDEATAASFAGAGGPAVGDRATVVPIVEHAGLPTFTTANASGADLLGEPGALLVYANDARTIPATTPEPRIARALAFLEGLPDFDEEDSENATLARTMTIHDAPSLDENGTAVRADLVVDLVALGVDGRGYLMKADHSTEVVFVPVDDVVGQVTRFDPASRIYLLFVSGSIGFVMPIVLLVATHRAPTGGAHAGVAGLCRECRTELPAGTDFCLRCGAWSKGEPDA